MPEPTPPRAETASAPVSFWAAVRPLALLLPVALLLLGLLVAVALQPPMSDHDTASGQDKPPTEATGARPIDSIRNAAGTLTQSLRRLGASPLNPAPGLYDDTSAVTLGPGGHVIITSKYSVMEYAPGQPAQHRQLLAPDRYHAQFPGEKFQAIHSSLALPDGRYLFGGWHGEVLLLTGERLQRLSGRDDPPTGRIADAVLWQDRIYQAGEGLWRLHVDEVRMQSVDGFGSRRLRALAASNNRLFVAEGQSLWVFSPSAGGWRAHEPPGGGPITRLRPHADGGVWVAHRRGLARLSAHGQWVEQLLPGVWVRDVAERGGQLWVGTWKQGLLLRAAGRWFRYGPDEGLPAASVAGVAIDGQEHIWLAVYGKGGWQAPAAELAATLQQHPWTPRPDPD